ncbi:MAG: hypothetical protein M1830_001047 [Pleopsidium flavum]|nr:MAG: hypothetical protein M1830_001047 [Pleopsidium flavum]
MSTAQADSVRLGYERDHSSQYTRASNSTSPPSARFTPDLDSDDESNSEAPAGNNRFEQTFQLKRSDWSQEKKPCLASSSQGDYEIALAVPEKHYRPRDVRRASDSTDHSFKLYTSDEERAIVRKFDRRLVLFMALLYMLSFLDRSNIGNARIAGLTRDLRLSSSQYEWLLTAFYITYILFEWMTLLYRLVPPHIYISLCVASWGLIASLQCVSSSFVFLVILRALLGISEAAFGPGVPFYLSFFYKREELALRTGLFISAAPLATSFASSLAWVITKLGEHGPIAPWRLLFLVEGFPSVLIAVFAWIYIPDSPGKAVYLNRRERKVAKLRLRKGYGMEGQSTEKRGLKWREIAQTLLDPKCYFTAMMFFSCNVAFSSLPVFLPTIMNEMGYTPLASQALCAPPYLVAFFVVLFTAYLSDRYRNRSAFVCLHAGLGAVGYSLIAVAGWRRWGIGWRYAGIYLAASGFFSAITIIITWTINNQESDSKKGTGVALLNVIGQLGPLVGTRLYPDTDKPYYVKGMSICAAFMFLVFALSLGLRHVLVRANGRSDVACLKVHDDDDQGLIGGDSEKHRPERFRFML